MAVKLTSTCSWELEQQCKLSEHRPDLVSTTLQRLLSEDNELRWALVVGAYLDRQVNLGKAAELLGTSALELRSRFLKLGIPLRMGPADLAEARAEVGAIRSWFQRPSQGSSQ